MTEAELNERLDDILTMGQRRAKAALKQLIEELVKEAYESVGY